MECVNVTMERAFPNTNGVIADVTVWMPPMNFTAMTFQTEGVAVRLNLSAPTQCVFQESSCVMETTIVAIIRMKRTTSAGAILVTLRLDSVVHILDCV